ncbi:hypothetical protein [Lysobacter tyrosinilyticus]
MKVRMAVLSASVLMLVACATTGEQGSYSGEPKKAYVQTKIDTDDAYVSRVEQIARNRGIQVTWVHPPRTTTVVKGKDD